MLNFLLILFLLFPKNRRNVRLLIRFSSHIHSIFPILGWIFTRRTCRTCSSLNRLPPKNPCVFLNFSRNLRQLLIPFTCWSVIMGAFSFRINSHFLRSCEYNILPVRHGGICHCTDIYRTISSLPCTCLKSIWFVSINSINRLFKLVAGVVSQTF